MYRRYLNTLETGPVAGTSAHIGRFLLVLVTALAVQACKHPLAIEGEGDIVERLFGHRGCTLEEFNASAPRCTENEAIDEPYKVSYEAVPREGWRFVAWEGTGCAPESVAPYCEHDITEDWVSFTDLTWPGIELPVTIAVFEQVQTGEFLVSESENNIPGGVSSAGLTDGGFVVVWHARPDAPNAAAEVFLKQFADTGFALGPMSKINSSSTDNRHSPGVAALSDGGFVVVWQGEGELADQMDIYTQQYDAVGMPTGTEHRVNTYTTGSQYEPVIAALNREGFVVVWRSLEWEGQGLDEDEALFGQRFDSSGTASGEEFRLSTFSLPEEDGISVAGLLDGGFVASWNDDSCCFRNADEDSSGTRIVARRYDAQGMPFSEEFQVNTTSEGDQWNPSVLALPQGGYLITWDSESPTFLADTCFGCYYSDVYGQIYDSSGKSSSAEFALHPNTTGERYWGNSAIFSNNNLVITWEEQTDSVSTVNAQLHNQSGVPLGAEFSVSSIPSNSSWSSVTALVAGGFLVSWVQDGDIRGRRFNSNGEEL